MVQFWSIIHIASDFNLMNKRNTLFTHCLAINYKTNDFNFYEKNTETLLTQFRVIIYITSELNLYEKTKTLLTQFWVIVYTPREFNF